METKPSWRGVCIIAGNGPTKERRVCNSCGDKCVVVVGLNDDDPKCKKEVRDDNNR